MPKTKTQGIVFGILMSFFWNMFAAAPLVHLIFEKWNGLSKLGVESEG